MELTPEVKARIDQYIQRRGRYPKNVTVANALKITKEEAEEVLNEHRKEHGKRIRSDAPMAMGGVQPASEGPKPDDGPIHKDAGSRVGNRHDRKWIDVAVDSGALTLAVVIDLILNAIVFWTISPDWITGIGMVCLSFIVVMFSLRGWVKGGWQGRALWLMFAVVATFSDISFALSTTDLQSRHSGDDPEMVRLTDKVDHDQAVLDKLLEGYTGVGTGYRTELTVRQTAIEDARKALQASEQSRKEYVKKEPTMDSKAVFEAIPDAVTAGRWIQLTFFLLVFVGLQLTIISSASKVSVDSVQ